MNSDQPPVMSDPDGAPPLGRIVAGGRADAFETLPVVIGVTGHRNPAAGAEPRLRARFSEILDEVHARYPDSPILVLSALADGADLLAAEVALDRGIRTMAVLPMPAAEYEQDFEIDRRPRFQAVLARCWETLVVKTAPGAKHRYVAAGSYIAYYAHIVVAFWDGEAGGPGGTSDVVRLRLTGLAREAQASDVRYVPDVGPVYQIVTPREGKPIPDHAFQTVKRHPQRFRGDRKGQSDFDAALKHLDTFNKDLHDVPEPKKRDRMLALRERTAKVANRLQTASDSSLKWMYGAALVAGAAQTIDAGGPGIAARIALLAIAFVIFARARKADYENRYQDYRAVSEGLRVQYAWCCAGMSDRLVEASYMRMQQTELQWIRLALRTAYLVYGGRDAIHNAAPGHPKCTEWLRDQRAYYLKAGKRELHARDVGHRVTIASGAAALGLCLLGALPLALRGAQQSPQLSHLLPMLAGLKLDIVSSQRWFFTYLASVPLALAGLVALLTRFYGEQRGFIENGRRYQHMYVVFDYALRRLHRSEKYHQGGDPCQLLEEVGREALAEHANWLVLHRERPLTFVHT